jgi:L-iditol 2-dehydrogenase
MIKITLKSPGEFIFNDVPEPIIKEGEALIEVTSRGICAGDICQYEGKKLDLNPLPSVQCHEFGGIVRQIKSSSGEIKIGDKVTVFPHIFCGNCYYCNNGMELTCENDKIFGIGIDGGLTEKVAVPVRLLVKFGDDFDERYLGIVEPASIAYHFISEIKNSNVVIIGVGSIGTMVVSIAKYNNNKVIAVDIDDNHLRTAKHLGADLILNVQDKDNDKKLKDFLGKDKIDFIGLTHLDQQLLDWSLKVIRKCGTIVFIDILEMPFLKVDFRKMWNKIITLKGHDSCDFKDFEEAAELIKKGIINPKDVVSKIFPLNKIKEAYDYKINENALKVILVN